MIGSISNSGNSTSQILSKLGINQVGQVSQTDKTGLDSLNKSIEDKKKTSDTLATNAKFESSEKTQDTENLMDTLSKNENQTLNASTVYGQANAQANRINGMQAYSQNGQSVFNFARF